MTRERLHVDLSLLTLRDMQEINNLLGVPFADALQGIQQPTAIAAAVWITQRRENPSFTLDDALDLSMMADVDLVGGPDAPGEAVAGNNGGPLAGLPASGA